ncbi:MAG: TonB-dependent receptor domain-containing protein [Bryobacteraceae bacterium]
MRLLPISAFVICFVAISPVAAQFTTASLGGTVSDPSGGVVAGARVVVRNVDTGLSLNSSTDSSGAYLFSRLPVGSYELTVENPGFTSYVQSGINLTVNQVATQDVVLQLGQVTGKVTVQAEAELITTRTATAGQLIDTRRVVDLPLNGRSAQSLLYLAAGTVELTDRYCNVDCHGGVYPSSAESAVNGSGPGQVNYQLDGTSHNDTYLNINLPFPNPDSIQEFNLQSSNFTAEYGNAGGGVVNIVTKSGTNELHGTLFHFLRNGALNARNFFAPRHDELKRNQFGGSIGGPIIRDKLFFFGTYQGTDIRSTAEGRIQFVPTQAQRQGDFSSISRQLVDPATRQPFPNNQIPANLLNPVAAFILEGVPLPNGPDGQLTFAGAPLRETEQQFMGKVDYQAGKHQLSGRFFFTDFERPPALTNGNLLVIRSGNVVRVQNVSVNHTYVASPSLLMTTTFGWNSQTGGSRGSGPFGLAEAGANIVGPESVPELDTPPHLFVNVSGGFSITSGHNGDFDRGDLTIREVVTKIAGAHELRVGGEAIRLNNPITNTTQMGARTTFNGQLSGSALADFILGRASLYTQGGGEFKDLVGGKWGLFFQDNWRLNQRLTLNLGLRWDPYIPYYDREGRAVCFDGSATVRSRRFPNAPLGLLYGGDKADPGCPRGGSVADWDNLAPRVGFAYRLTSSGNTVLRGGAGYFYTPIDSSEMNAFTNTAPFGGQFSLNDIDLSDPFGSKGLPNPFPNNYGNVLAGPDFVFAPINDVRWYFTRDFQTPLLTTWNLRLEHQFASNLLVGASYVGNKGTYLRVRVHENPAIYIPGIGANGAPLSTVGNTQQRRTYKDFSVIRRIDSGGNSQHHGLQLNVEKRFSQGFSFLSNYTWSKTTDNLSSANPFNRAQEHAVSADDVSHVFKLSNIYQFPQIRVTGALDKLLNGWSLNSIVLWRSGFPMSVLSGVDNSFSAVGEDRADFLGGEARFSGLSHAEQIRQFFDISRFVVNAPGTFGNSGRGVLRGPGYFNADLSVLKDTNLTERFRAQIRAEFFNVFNTVRFNNPNTNRSAPQFGRITSARDPRILQFALKLIF